MADWYASTATYWRQSLPGHTVDYPAGLPVYYSNFGPAVGEVVDTSSITPTQIGALSASDANTKGWDPTLNLIRPAYDGYTVTPSQSVLYRTEAQTPAPGRRATNMYFV